MPNKVILITGASRGIGFETSLYLAKKKLNLLTVARSADLLEKLHKQYPSRIDYLPCDLMDNLSIQSLVDVIREKGVELSGMLLNAGRLVNKPFIELSDSDWNSMWNTNVMSAVRLLRALLPFFSTNAHILTISSMGGYQGSSKFTGLSAYSTSKGALSIWTECMAVELNDKKISCNCLCLGAVQTEMFEEAFPGHKAPVNAKQMAEYIGDFMLNGHKYMNGKIIPVSMSDP